MKFNSNVFQVTGVTQIKQKSVHNLLQILLPYKIITLIQIISLAFPNL